MALADSLDKVIGIYLTRVSKQPIQYKGKTFLPVPLAISPLIFRGFTCPEGCGGCCPKFSLDYLPGEDCPEICDPRIVSVNGLAYSIWSDMQHDNPTGKCRNLRFSDGRCGIYTKRPMSCDFELIRFICSKDKTLLTQKLFGRGWNMLRVDGERGALCSMTPPSPETIEEVLRKLHRLKRWADYLRLDTWLPEVIAWARFGPYDHPFRCTT